MADNKSSEGKLTTLECMECGFREVFTESQFKNTDGLSCLVCKGPVNPAITRTDEPIRNRRMKEFKQLYRNKTISAGSLIITADVSDALKGLKAIQREARRTTAALKEVESYPGTIRRTTLKADNEVVDEHFDYSLLTIDLFTIDSVPRVFYKGEEITGKIHVGFDWSTQTDKTVSSPMIDIEYADTTSKRPSIKRISHNPLGGDTNG